MYIKLLICKNLCCSHVTEVENVFSLQADEGGTLGWPPFYWTVEIVCNLVLRHFESIRPKCEESLL